MFNLCSQCLLSLIQLKKYLLIIYPVVYTKAAVYDSNVGVSSCADANFGFYPCLNTVPEWSSDNDSNDNNNNTYLLFARPCAKSNPHN